MTDDRCLTADELAGRSDWPAGDARRAHLESCGRCQALLASLERFEAEPADLPRERLAEARERLSRARGEWPGARPAPAPLRRAARPAPWTWRAWRPAMAAAALVVVAASAWWAGRALLPGAREVQLRSGEAPGPPSSRASLVTLPPRPGVDGPLLRWRALPAAEEYVVTLLDASLAEIVRTPAVRDTALSLGAIERLAGPAAREAAYWQVAARRAGDVVAESAPAPLETAGRRRAE